MTNTTPKHEVLLRLSRIVDGLRAGRYEEEAEALDRVVKALKRSVKKEASIQEVVLRAIDAVIRGEVTLAGRLVDALAYVGKQYGVTLAMHPALLVAVAVGGQNNPDRDDAAKNLVLDQVLAALLEDPAPYQESLYVLASLARGVGLDETADMAVQLLKDIAEGGEQTAAEQALVVEKRSAERPGTPDSDELSWVVKMVLTLTTLALVAASASKLAGGIADVIKGMDDLLDKFGLGGK